MGRLFGTDGARGIANTELTCELSMEIGRAAAMVLTEQTNKKPKFLIGMEHDRKMKFSTKKISAH